MSTFLIQFLTGLASAASLFMVAAGLSIIFGVSRIVNFAHGSFYMLGAYLAYSLGQRFGGSGLGFWSAVVLAALLVGCAARQEAKGQKEKNILSHLFYCLTSGRTICRPSLSTISR